MTEPLSEKPIDAAGEIKHYDYDLPESAIAQYPVEPRDNSRLLVLDRGSDTNGHRHFHDLPELLNPGDLLVLNDTRVIPARLFGKKKPGGGRAELFLIRDLGEGFWEAMIRLTGKLRSGQQLDLERGFMAELIEPAENPSWRVAISGPAPVDELLENSGHMPLPPYIKRNDNPADRERYQTVFARNPGAVAAPTAGLHFTSALLERLMEKGVVLAWVTLHVGPGTFRPLEEEDLRRGCLHEEWYHLPRATIEAIEATKANGNKVVTVGTTATRVLEACANESGRLSAGDGVTRLFIRCPYHFRVVDALITNFHLPRSSLLMLVAALAGRGRILNAYREAVNAGYRFYSYGDGMFIC